MNKTTNAPENHMINSEYRAATSIAALYNSSSYGRLLVSGADHLGFFHRMTTNHFEALENGYGIEAVFAENRGRILDCCTFYHRDNNTLVAISPPARTLIPEWIDRYIFTEAIDVQDISDTTSMFELFGPQTPHLVNQVLQTDLASLQPHQLIAGTTLPTELWLAAHPRANQMGLRAIGPESAIGNLRQQFVHAGAQALSEDTWEILRVERGIPSHGNELNDEHNPWEAGLDNTINMNKGCYIGQEVIARLDTYDKIKQRLVGLTLDQQTLPSRGTVLQSDGSKAGTITSVALSPTFGPIALAYIGRKFCQPSTALQSLDGKYSGQVSALPFSLT